MTNLSQPHPFWKGILVAGFFDRQMLNFITWFRHFGSNGTKIRALAPRPFDIPDVDEWITGPRGSASPIRKALDGVDAAFWFYLTPLPNTKTREGYALDTALMEAIQFVHLLSPDVVGAPSPIPVVLVTRQFPNDNRKFDENYDFLRKVFNIFKTKCENVRILRISPEISSDDAISLSMFEYALRHKTEIDSKDTRWLNLTRPFARELLSPKILEMACGSPRCDELDGAIVLSYDEYRTFIARGMTHKSSRHVSRFIKSPRRLAKIAAASRRREKLLFETLQFHTTDPTLSANHSSDRTELARLCRHFAEDMLESYPDNPPILLLEPTPSDSSLKDHPCIVYSLPPMRRSVRETAALFMRWIPHYFKNAVNLKEHNDRQILCCLSHIPVFELERTDGDETLSQLSLHHPWIRRREHRIIMTFASIPGDSLHDGLMFLCIENAPRTPLWNAIESRIVHAFAKFVCEYG